MLRIFTAMWHRYSGRPNTASSNTPPSRALDQERQPPSTWVGLLSEISKSPVQAVTLALFLSVLTWLLIAVVVVGIALFSDDKTFFGRVIKAAVTGGVGGMISDILLALAIMMRLRRRNPPGTAANRSDSPDGKKPDKTPR